MRPTPVLIYGKSAPQELCYVPFEHKFRQDLPTNSSRSLTPSPAPLVSPSSSPSRAYRMPTPRTLFDLCASAPLASAAHQIHSVDQATQMESAKHVIVGTAGHIDHGKSALVEALTGTHPDRLEEEKRRGITIDLGFAFLDLGAARLGFVDVPGHERFVRNMLAGVGGIDLVLLVIAADESIKPQTREHFDICRLLGIPRGIIAITKSDLVEADVLGLVHLEIDELVAGSFLEGAPVVPVSSATGAGLVELRRE